MKKTLLATMLLLFLLFAGTALATITIENARMTCDPLNNANNSCYKGSNFTMKFVLTDDNFVSTITDGNLQHWRPVIKVLNDCNFLNSEVSMAPTDTNLSSSLVCDKNFAAAGDRNFVRARACTLNIPAISTLGTGRYCVDLNIQECSLVAGATCTVAGKGITSDKNASITFYINNKLTSNSTMLLALLIPLLVLVGGAFVAIKTDNATPAYFIGLLVTVAILGAIIILLGG